MNLSDAGLDLIKQFEGLRLMAYRCSAGVLTIGYGTTGDWIRPRMIITKARAEELLREDVRKFERGVSRLIEGVPTSQNEFDAMTSLSYNIGLGGFQRSSVLRHHRAGRRLSAANAFLLWVKAGGRKIAGLVKRRTKERSLYLS